MSERKFFQIPPGQDLASALGQRLFGAPVYGGVLTRFARILSFSFMFLPLSERVRDAFPGTPGNSALTSCDAESHP
jgi:hypothetical protein